MSMMKVCMCLSALFWVQIGLCQNYYQGVTTVTGDKEVYSVIMDPDIGYTVRNQKNSFLWTPIRYADGTEVPKFRRFGGGILEGYGLKDAAEEVFTASEIARLKERKIGFRVIVAISPETCRTLEMEFRIPNDSVICTIFTPKKLEQFERAYIQNTRWKFRPNHPQVNYIWMSSSLFCF